jgi:DNA (cytosine-5)-methyltransferase 1
MKYLSVCSGVEAATVAWHDFGWTPVGFSEIEPFPSAVLAHRYPHVTNFGDMTKYKDWNLNESIDLLVGGTPCQSFSVAGLRKGLEDPRGNLALTYVGILDKFRPKWCVWENVPGVLSSNGGRDFGAFLGALVELGYGFAYRVLDAQNFGVPQRRRRVFVVGCLGDWESAAKVLFEPASLLGDIKKSKGKGQDITTFTASSFGGYSEGIGTLRTAGGDLGGGSETLYVPNTARCLTRGVSQKNDFETDTFITKVYENHASDSRVKEVDVCPTVTAKWGTGGGNVPLAQAKSLAVRRLTPVECERLQGFPDNYTNIKDKCPDSPRYKAMGNSMAVPVMRWIGKRIEQL